MSISNALNNAISGLSVASRSAQLVSGNLANAMNESYARREIVLGTSATGGTKVAGFERVIDLAITKDRREAEASASYYDTLGSAVKRIEDSIGLPTEGHSLSAKVAVFESALISAASQPESEARLSAVVDGARSLTNKFREISADIQNVRRNADTEIASDVRRLNDGLEQIAELNSAIIKLNEAGRNASPLLDQRQALIDSLSEIVPIIEVQKDRGAVALFSQKGAILLDGRPATFSFSQAGFVGTTSSLGVDLSGLAIDGAPISTQSSSSVIAGGRLASNFYIRDNSSVNFQADLDAAARNLVQRFEGSDVDPTSPLGAPGLFSDDGLSFSPASEAGLSERLSINDAVARENGGSVQAIRDGLYATAPREVGDAFQITEFLRAFESSALVSIREHDELYWHTWRARR